MQQAANKQHDFVIDLLETLRSERFRPLGWWHFLQRAWDKSWATAKNNPALRRSWVHHTSAMLALTIVMIAVTLFFEGRTAALQLLPGLCFCVAWQQSDLFWHLGLNRHVSTGILVQRVGLANTLTGVRGLIASYLIGRLIGGLMTSSTLALILFSLGVVTDILDGLVARGTDTPSKLGQIIDGETDFCLYVALTSVLLQNGLLSPWLALAMVFRFITPFCTALISYFLFAQPVRFGSTSWGKCAGFFQFLYLLVLLLPASLYGITTGIRLPLLIIMLLFMLLAPVAQLYANIQGNDAWKGLLR